MQLYQAVHGGPQPGITQKLDAILKDLHLMEGQREEEKDQRAEQHEQNAEKLNKINSRVGMWGLVIGVATITLAACALVVTITIFILTHGHAELSVPDFLLQHLQGQEYADKQQPSQTAVDVSLR